MIQKLAIDLFCYI